MIKGFEDITARLTEEELTLVDPIVRSLRRRVGVERAITNEEMCFALNTKDRACKVSPPRLRKIIRYIRINHLVINLIATSKGYYVAETKREMKDYISSLFQRGFNELALAESMNDQMKITFGDAGFQLKLEFTDKDGTIIKTQTNESIRA